VLSEASLGWLSLFFFFGSTKRYWWGISLPRGLLPLPSHLQPVQQRQPGCCRCWCLPGPALLFLPLLLAPNISSKTKKTPRSFSMATRITNTGAVSSSGMGGLKRVGEEETARLHESTLAEGLMSFGELKRTFPAGSLCPNRPFFTSCCWTLPDRFKPSSHAGAESLLSLANDQELSPKPPWIQGSAISTTERGERGKVLAGWRADGDAVAPWGISRRHRFPATDDAPGELAPPQRPAWTQRQPWSHLASETRRDKQLTRGLHGFLLFDHAQRPVLHWFIPGNWQDGEEGWNQAEVIPVIHCPPRGSAPPAVLVPRQGQAPALVLLPVMTSAGHHEGALQVFSWGLVSPSRLGCWGPALQTYVSLWFALKSSDLGEN